MKALDKYFDERSVLKDGIITEENRSLCSLLEAMRDFSDKVRLCRYGEFTESVEQLKRQLDNFVQDAAEKNNNDIQIVFSFIDEIKKKYSTLFAAVEKNTADKDLRLIRWCIDNDCLQQAMTLITERVPEYYFGAGILAVADKVKESFKKNYYKYKNNSKSNKASKYYWLLSINTYSIDDKKDIYDQLAEAVKLDLREICKIKKQHSTVGVDLKKNINNLKEKIKKIKMENDCFSSIDSVAAEKNLVELYEYLSNRKKESYDFNTNGQIKILENLKKNIDIIDRSVKYSKRDIIEKILIPICNNKEIESKQFIENIGIEIEEYPGNYNEIKQQLKTESLITLCPQGAQDTILKSLLLYFEIKEERNAVNHAHNEKEQITFDELKNKIKQLLDLLEELKND